jgi:perosamine synthetase
MIPLSVPEIRGNEWKYIKECLDTNWVSSVGLFVDRFEQMLADYVGVKHAVATINGTAALHTALLVAGIQPDDEVLVSTLTFIAPANAIRYVGAWPVFIDAEPDYWQMDPQKVVDFLEEDCRWAGGELRNKATGRQVKAIIPVHILGHPVDLDPILTVARKYNLVVIEDATESLGAKYKGRMVGHLGDIACFSFNGNKLISTGGGGMVVTDNEEWAQRARHITTQAKDDPVEYIHDEIGYNYRLTNIQAAMGVAQMEQIDDYIVAKRRIAAAYGEGLEGIPGLEPMRQASWAESAFWLFTVMVDEQKFGSDSRTLLKKLNSLGVQTRPLWQPMHLSPAHADLNPNDCPVANQLYRDGLSIPCSVNLGDSQHDVVEALSLQSSSAKPNL